MESKAKKRKICQKEGIKELEMREKDCEKKQTRGGKKEQKTRRRKEKSSEETKGKVTVRR